MNSRPECVFDGLLRVLRSTAIFVRIELLGDVLPVVYRMNDLLKYSISSSKKQLRATQRFHTKV